MHDRIRQLTEQWRDTPEWRRGGGLAFFCAVLFILVNWRNYVVDHIPQALVPVTLWRHGTVRLDVYRDYYETLKTTNQDFPFTPVDGHLYPRNSIYDSILVAPLYLPPILLGKPTEDVRFWIAWGGLASAAWSGVGVGLVYCTLRRWGDDGPALALSLMLAFGSCVWTYIGHTVYDNLGAFVCVAALAHALHDFPLTPGRATWAAFLAGAAVSMRPVSVVLLFPLGLYLLAWPGAFAGWKARIAAGVAILVMPACNAVSNAWCFGAWNKTGYPEDLATDWNNPWWEGLSGLLISPNSGLLTQSPYFALALVGGWAAWTKSDIRERGILRCYTICFLVFWILFAHRGQWQGGIDFSTRYLSDGYPLWMPLVMVGWNRVRRLRGALPLLAAVGAWAFLYELANIATFDAILDANRYPLPPLAHDPWRPWRHFLVVHVNTFGAGSTLAAILLTAGQFALCASVTIYVLKPFVVRQLADLPKSE